jgi:predicted metal-dependent phosphoesterase TrpH
MLRARPAALLAELHAHTTWSDGALSVRELVDLYGWAGFDVLCVTDHVVRTDDPWLADESPRPNTLPLERHAEYLAELELEAARALRTYGLVVVPGLELTYNDLDPAQAAHALALGLRKPVSVDTGIEAAIEAAVAAGAAVVAAHPFDREETPHPSRLTRRFACDPSLARRAHRFELFNRRQLFGWVAAAGLSGVASGDFHRPEHLSGWKTLIPCARDEQAVVAYLRSSRPVYLACLDDDAQLLAA